MSRTGNENNGGSGNDSNNGNCSNSRKSSESIRQMGPQQKRNPRTLGPVPDLERHLPSEWWRTLFNSIYLKTDGDVVENQLITESEIDDVLRIVSLDRNDRILDLCCGQGRHCLELARRGFSNVSGMDRSRYLVRLARQRARRSNLSVTFREGDARKLAAARQSYHCILMMGNSFGYFETEEDDLQVLRACHRALLPGGRLILDIADGNWMRTHFEPRSWEWIDQQHFVCRERGLSAAGDRLISREVVTHAEKGVLIDQFYAERLYSEGNIRSLLETCCFEDIQFHGELRPESDRNQDLGMMAQRMLISARTSDVERASRIPRKTPFPNILVLQGDHRLPDTVKREGQFNSEDMETIDRMKAALGELKEYVFSYFDDHSELLIALRENPPEFVFNLCDEGFLNDAFKELHVPAYLEMLNIPYTGSGPGSLGLCYDKALVRAVAASMDIPVPAETYYTPDDLSATLPTTFPALVKPNFGDSSIGITKDAVVRDPEQLIEYIAHLRQQLPERPILIQEYLEGPEYSVGIVGNPGLSTTFLPILEVDYSRLPTAFPKILGYESKWIPGSPWWDFIRYRPAELSTEAGRNLIDQSMMLFERLGCRDYARFDFRADSMGIIKLLEVNPNPGWCWDGKMNYMAGFSGLRYSDLLRLIIDAAQERWTAAR